MHSLSHRPKGTVSLSNPFAPKPTANQMLEWAKQHCKDKGMFGDSITMDELWRKMFSPQQKEPLKDGTRGKIGQAPQGYHKPCEPAERVSSKPSISMTERMMPLSWIDKDGYKAQDCTSTFKKLGVPKNDNSEPFGYFGENEDELWTQAFRWNTASMSKELNIENRTNPNQTLGKMTITSTSPTMASASSQTPEPQRWKCHNAWARGVDAASQSSVPYTVAQVEVDNIVTKDLFSRWDEEDKIKAEWLVTMSKYESVRAEAEEMVWHRLVVNGWGAPHACQDFWGPQDITELEIAYKKKIANGSGLYRLHYLIEELCHYCRPPSRVFCVAVLRQHPTKTNEVEHAYFSSDESWSVVRDKLSKGYLHKTLRGEDAWLYHLTKDDGSMDSSLRKRAKTINDEDDYKQMLKMLARRDHQLRAWGKMRVGVLYQDSTLKAFYSHRDKEKHDRRVRKTRTKGVELPEDVFLLEEHVPDPDGFLPRGKWGERIYKSMKRLIDEDNKEQQKRP